MNIFKDKDKIIEILENNNIEYNVITTLGDDHKSLYDCIAIYYNTDNSVMEAGTIIERKKINKIGGEK